MPTPDYLSNNPKDEIGLPSQQAKTLGALFNELIMHQQDLRAGRLNPDKTPGFTAYYPGEGAAGTFHDSGEFAKDSHRRALERINARENAPSIVELMRAMGYPINTGQ